VPCADRCRPTRTTDAAYGAVQCATHGAHSVVERAAHGAAHAADRAVEGHHRPRCRPLPTGAVERTTDCIACGADRTTHQPTDTQCAVLRRNRCLAGQLQIAIGNHFLAIRRLHAHLAGSTSIECCGDRAIVGFSRQFLLGGQRDRRRRLYLALGVDLVACHLQLRIQRPIHRRLQTPQCARRRAADAGGRLCTGID
jgi:hypothetical protein